MVNGGNHENCVLEGADIVHQKDLYDIQVVDEDRPDITTLVLSVTKAKRSNTLNNNKLNM